MRLYYHPVSSNSRRVLLTALLLEGKLPTGTAFLHLG